MIAASLLAGGRSVGEALSMLLQEIHEGICRMGCYPIDITGTAITEILGNQFPDNIDLRASDRRKHVRYGIHPAVARGCLVSDVMLNDKTTTNGFDIDRHQSAIIGRGNTGSNVILRAAALIFGFWQMKQPVSDIYGLERNIQFHGKFRLGQDLIVQNFHNSYSSLSAAEHLTALTGRNVGPFMVCDKIPFFVNSFARIAKMTPHFAEFLAAFADVVRYGSFSAAARHRAMTPSAIVRQIDTLEQDLGVALFVRSTRALTLTDAGERLHERAIKLLDDMADTQAEIAAFDGKVSGVLRIACYPTFGKRYILPVLAELQTKHSALHVELDLTEKLAAPVPERLDLVIRMGELADSTLIATKLAPQKRILVASPAYLTRAGNPDGQDESGLSPVAG